MQWPDSRWRASFRRRLLRWFDRHQRELPWRGVSDAYRVWVSEIMLQQTQVATVIPYYERFLARFPTVVELAEADEPDVLRLWEGLGYYRRARQLHAAAKQVVAEHAGCFPTEFDDVLALPGVGRYTAGAILSIARDQRHPIVEANTIRLYSRLLALRDDVSSSQSQATFWRFAAELLPRTRCGDFNQALMELGAEICKPRSPRCEQCPVRTQCPTREQNAQDEIPAPKKKPKFEDRREAAVVIRRGSLVLLRVCGGDERWAGLSDFPRFEIPDTKGALAAAVRDGVRRLTGLQVEPGPELLTLKHGVTRFRITLQCFAADWIECLENKAALEDPQRRLRWVDLADLPTAPLNTTGRKLADHLRSQARQSTT